MSENSIIQNIIEQLKTLSLFQASELVKEIETVFGVDASAANIFDDADLGVGARAGYAVSENVLAYTRVGYTNLDFGRRSVDGATIGGGFEVNVSDSMFVKAEYRYTDFDGNLGRHGGLVGIGLRF